MGTLSLLLLFLYLFRHSLVTANEGKVDWRASRMFAVSDKSIMAPGIERSKKGKGAVQVLLNYYKALESSMIRQGAEPSDYDRLTPGVLPGLVRFFGWPKVNETERPYKPPKRGEELRQFARMEKRIFKALEDLGDVLDTPAVADPVKNLLNWTHSFHSDRRNYSDMSHDCDVRSNAGYRINGKWSLRALVTNDRPESWLAEWRRLYLSEYLMLENNRISVQPYFFNLSRPIETRMHWGNRPFSRTGRTRVTSMMAKWGGQAGVNIYGQHDIADNIAMIAALEDSRDLTRQVMDSRTGSEIAILVFPIFMAAVPIALFADVSDAALLGYMLFTDFISVLPLAIKGGEILKAGTASYFSTRTMVFGDLESKNLVAAATWSCSCVSNPNNRLRLYGSLFVASALVAMVIGISLEFLARSQAEKLRQRRELDLTLANVSTESIWERPNPCYNCTCDEHVAQNGAPRASQRGIGGGLIAELQQRRMEERRAGNVYVSFRGG